MAVLSPYPGIAWSALLSQAMAVHDVGSKQGVVGQGGAQGGVGVGDQGALRLLEGVLRGDG
jgi:hypothetical protein